jgi:ABC-type spermidine/putrescine transport system permease subunit II
MKISYLVRSLGLTCLLGACAIGALAAPAFASEKTLTYSVAAGATGKPIVVPAVNTPVSMTCTQNQVGFRGVGQATILRIGSTPPQFLEWVGMDIATTAVTSGFSATAGTHVVYCDYVGKTVDLQVKDQNSLQIQNTGSSTATGVITFIW